MPDRTAEVLFTLFLLSGICMLGCNAVRKPMYGGQTKVSPDGKYSVSIVNPIEEDGKAVLRVLLELTDSKQRKLLDARFEIPGRESFIPLREAKSVIVWSDDSEWFTIDLNNAELITINAKALERGSQHR